MIVSQVTWDASRREESLDGGVTTEPERSQAVPGPPVADDEGFAHQVGVDNAHGVPGFDGVAGGGLREVKAPPSGRI